VEIFFPFAGGIDVHKRQVTVTVRTPDGQGGRAQKTRTFSTYTRDLLKMARWLVDDSRVTAVAMESTGPYWWPVYDALVLVSAFVGLDLKIEVVNAQHVKAVPGRKTDVKDSQWLCQLMEVGLLRGSFIPPDQVRRLRDWTRYQTKLIQEKTREKQRLLKVLESAGIKLDNVASDVFGVSGRLMLNALVAGERDQKRLADLAKGVLRNKIDDLRLALEGRFSDHHGKLVAFHLQRIDALEQDLVRVNAEIGSLEPDAPHGLVGPFLQQARLLTTIPGIGPRIATSLIAEIGVDMSRFPGPHHLSAWAGLAPGNNESAGRRKRAKRRKGNPYVAAILLDGAYSASRTHTRLGARFWRLLRRFGGPNNRTANKKAAYALAHTMLKIVWVVLSTGQPYQDLGHDYYGQRFDDPEARKRALVTRLEALTGQKVTLADPTDPGEPLAA
jgi:transposase